MATELEGIKMARPMTHDLLRNVLKELGASVEAIEVTELRENTYYALIHLEVGDPQHRLPVIAGSGHERDGGGIGGPLHIVPLAAAAGEVVAQGRAVLIQRHLQRDNLRGADVDHDPPEH